MTTSAQQLPASAPTEGLRGPVRLAALGFAVFLTGVATTMAVAGLLSPLLLGLAAAINLVLMLAICAATAAALDLGTRHPEGAPARRMRIPRRALQLATFYWTAAGLAFLLSPLLARI